MNMNLRSKIAQRLGLPEKYIIPEFYPILISMLKLQDSITMEFKNMNIVVKNSESETKSLQEKIKGKISINDHSKLKPFHSFIIVWGWLFAIPFVLIMIWLATSSYLLYINYDIIQLRQIVVQNENEFFVKKENYKTIFDKKGKPVAIKLKANQSSSSK